jgi:hypothetical protein
MGITISLIAEGALLVAGPHQGAATAAGGQQPSVRPPAPASQIFFLFPFPYIYRQLRQM